MKRLISIILLLFICAALCGCDDLNYYNEKYYTKITKVHILKNEECYEIINWNNQNSDEIIVNIKNYGICRFDRKQIILVEDKCPICDKIKTEE